jgi:hypothetical protein
MRVEDPASVCGRRFRSEQLHVPEQHYEIDLVTPKLFQDGLIPNPVVNERWSTDSVSRNVRRLSKLEYAGVRIVAYHDAWSSFEPSISAGLDHCPHVGSAMRCEQAESQHVLSSYMLSDGGRGVTRES